jgi:hypothetical protein
MSWLWSLPSPSATQIQEPKTKVEPAGKIILPKSIEPSSVNFAESPYLARQLSVVDD